MRKAKVAKKKRVGRPWKGGRAYSIKLTNETAAKLRKLGDGNLTLGIERAASQSTSTQEG